MVAINAIISKLSYTEEAEVTPAIVSGEYKWKACGVSGVWGVTAEALLQERSAPRWALSTQLPAPPGLGSRTPASVAVS